MNHSILLTIEERERKRERKILVPDASTIIMANSSHTIPPVMRAWLYSSVSGGLLNNLDFVTSARMPPPPRQNQLLIQTISMSLNPADYKIPEMTSFALRLLTAVPASPGMDFCGRVAAVGEEAASQFKKGQLVFGALPKPSQFGPLAEYMVCNADYAAVLPEGVDPDIASTVGIAGQTGYQSLAPYVSPGDKVLITGGSGGCGVYSIQIAKILGCHVTTTCSSRNVQLCKDLGADEVIDYTSQDVVEVVKSKGQVYSHVVDYTGLPYNLYRESHHFLLPGKTFLQIGGPSILATADRMLRPAILGGGRRKHRHFFTNDNQRDIAKIGEYLKEKKIKVNLDGVFEFEDATKAFEQLQSGRTRGKNVIHISKKP